jgi:hypothetical protein
MKAFTAGKGFSLFFKLKRIQRQGAIKGKKVGVYFSRAGFYTSQGTCKGENRRY